MYTSAGAVEKDSQKKKRKGGQSIARYLPRKSRSHFPRHQHQRQFSLLQTTTPFPPGPGVGFFLGGEMFVREGGNLDRGERERGSCYVGILSEGRGGEEREERVKRRWGMSARSEIKTGIV